MGFTEARWSSELRHVISEHLAPPLSKGCGNKMINTAPGPHLAMGGPRKKIELEVPKHSLNSSGEPSTSTRFAWSPDSIFGNSPS